MEHTTEHITLTRQERGWLWTRLGIRLGLVLGAALLLVRLGPPILSLLMPFVLALLVSWLLNPLVRSLQRRLSLPRKGLSLALVVLLLAGVGAALYGLVWACAAQLVNFFENWESVVAAVSDTLDSLEAFLAGVTALLPENVTMTAEDLMDGALEQLQGALSRVAEAAPGYVTAFAAKVPGAAVAVVVFVMASYFITADYPIIRGWLTGHMAEEARTFGAKVRDVFTAAFGGYIKSQVILSLGVFAILAVGFTLVGQSYSLLLALALAVLDFIPIIGSGTVMVPWAVVDVILGDYRGAVELMVIWGVVCLFRRVAEPKIVGDQTGLSPILSLLSIYVGMRLGGVMGMILGPVLTVVLVNLARLGIFDPTLQDLRLAARDITGLLRRR